MKPWEGGIITALNHSFENLDSSGHGVKLESTCMVVSPPPLFLLVSLPCLTLSY